MQLIQWFKYKNLAKNNIVIPIGKSLIWFRHVEIDNLDLWSLIWIKQSLNQIKVFQMKVNIIQRIVIRINRPKKKNTPKENNDINQSTLIWLTYDTIQGIMNRIKMHDTQETRAERMIDMNQGNLNRIKHLERKKSFATQKGRFLHIWHPITICQNEAENARCFNMF